jgi:hypothetical protein
MKIAPDTKNVTVCNKALEQRGASQQTRDSKKSIEIMDSRSKNQSQKKVHATKDQFIPVPKLPTNVSIRGPLFKMFLKLNM